MNSHVATREPILVLDRLTKAFGGLQAVNELSFHVNEGEILGFIGPNGAGKTTVFNLIMGIYRPTRGKILLQGQDISGWPPYRVVNAGIGRTFQIPRPFRHKTVDQNVEISTLPNEIFTRRPTPEERRQQVFTCLTRTGLCEVCGQDPSQCTESSCACRREYPMTLPNAGLRKLEIAKALATDPALLLLDEPFAGLTQAEVKELSDLLKELSHEGRTLVIVDHNMRGLMKLVQRVVVLHFGQKLAEGMPQDVAKDPTVQEAYLAGSGP